MRPLPLNLNEPPNPDGYECFVMLTKDCKPICRTECINYPPVEMSSSWNISEIARTNKAPFVSGLPRCFLRPAWENIYQKKEWGEFMGFLQKNERIAIVRFKSSEFYILPPAAGKSFSHAVVAYRIQRPHNTLDVQKQDISVLDETLIVSRKLNCSDTLMHKSGVCSPHANMVSTNSYMNSSLLAHPREVVTPSYHRSEEFSDKFDGNVMEGSSNAYVEKLLPRHKFQQTIVDGYARESREDTICGSQQILPKHDVEKNFVQTHPSYLVTLGQVHSEWIFGAIAELVDNSRDAKASKLEISIENLFLKKLGKNIPMLSVIDDGHGMSHQDIVRMLSLGHGQPNSDDPDHIGRFGVGFKTGAMRLGKDAFVLTQTANSRSIAFLSQSLNEGNNNLEIPIVSYCRRGQFMEVDTSIQSEALAEKNLLAIKEFSPFNEYLIGEKIGLFCSKFTGTQIYIWNLDEWGSGYSLEWHTGESGSSTFLQGDIQICSRRIRTRPGQISRKVPLDFSLRAYLEVIFLDPRMRIFVQGSLVKSRPLAKTLNRTLVIKDHIMGKPVQLTLGRSQLEWEQSNCGIFLYWHGRLIEAYKRVGGMIHNADMGRGIIGVIDITNLMYDGNGRVWVHNSKQRFQDCEAYAILEEWLGNRADEYWDNNFDTLNLKKGNASYKPDHEWVQCDKCRKWRVLSPGFDSRKLPQQWFCQNEPFYGSCDIPEQHVERGVITVGTKRSGCDPSKKFVHSQGLRKASTKRMSEGDSEGESSQTVEDDLDRPVLKRLRRGPARRKKCP